MGVLVQAGNDAAEKKKLRGRPFDSEGGGGLALFGNKYSDLENAGNK